MERLVKRRPKILIGHSNFKIILPIPKLRSLHSDFQCPNSSLYIIFTTTKKHGHATQYRHMMTITLCVVCTYMIVNVSAPHITSANYYFNVGK